jgi:hypothetical protein
MRLPAFRAIALVAVALAPTLLAQAPVVTSELVRPIAIRSLGPGLVTGRVADVKIDKKNPSTWYVVAAFGGVWKTTNRGLSFTPIFDNGGTHNSCCIEIDPKNSNILWLGTGENHSQRSAHFGDGLYKSTDAGQTWNRVGLENSEHIGRIAIDPRNSDHVYVAATAVSTRRPTAAGPGTRSIRSARTPGSRTS